MRLRIRFKDETHIRQTIFKDVEVDRIDLNPPNSLLVTQGEGAGSVAVLHLNTMGKVTVT